LLLSKVADLCKVRGISLWKLEKILGFGNGTVSKWATTVPGIDKVRKVADYFEVSVDYLLGRGESIGLSSDGKILAITFDSFSNDKQELIKRYIQMLKAS
jgi:transcriptional regulator with XRE-family HTH domain